MKILYENYKCDYCSIVVEHKNNRFKVVAENGNDYSRIRIYVFTNNGDLSLIACEKDIKNAVHVDFVDSDAKRLNGSIRNISFAKDYISCVYK